jgi:capsular exopolysaccharide synthesis family protein
MANQPDLVTLTDPQSPAAEAFRTLRTNLMFAGLDKPIRTLLVTAPSPDQSTAAVLANLAVAFAQAERRTILVDADLRRPALHDVFGVDNGHGLTDMILQPETLSRPATVDVGVPNLWLLPSGAQPPNPADTLGSRRMEAAIASLAEQADVVLFACAPVIVGTDAAVLGTKVDGVLLVLNAGKTRRDHAERAKEMLEKVQARIFGAVLNNAPGGITLGGY